MTVGTAFIIWMLCAGLCYFIARDRAPSKAPLATLLGFALGPIGVAVTFFLHDDDGPTSEDVGLKTLDHASKVQSAARSASEIEADIKRMKDRLSK